MQKETAQKILKIFGVLNYIFGAITLIIGALFMANFVPNLNEEIQKAVNINWQGLQPVIVLGIIFLITGLVTIFEGWALRRAAKDSTKTTLALILTILSSIGSVMTLFTGSIGVSQVISVLINALLLYSIVTVKKEA